MCAVKWFLDIPCPGCGLLSAFLSLLQGQWAESFSLFPLWPAVLVYFLCLRRSQRAGKVFVVLLVGQWSLRIFFREVL